MTHPLAGQGLAAPSQRGLASQYHPLRGSAALRFCARFWKSSSVTCQSCFWAALSECPRKAVACGLDDPQNRETDYLVCRVVELLLELLSTTLSRVLDSLPPVLMTPATLPPTGWGFLCADGAHYFGEVLGCSAAHRGLRAKGEVKPLKRVPGLWYDPWPTRWFRRSCLTAVGNALLDRIQSRSNVTRNVSMDSFPREYRTS